jgi:tight adherence protein B
MLSTSLWVITFLVLFAASAVAASAAWNAGERRRRKALDDRLERALQDQARLDPDLLKREVTSHLPFYSHLLERFEFTATMRQHLAQANQKWSVGFLTGLMLVTGLVALNIAIRLPWFPGYLAPVAAVAAGSIPYGYVMRKRARRLGKFEEQFPDSLDFMARAMRAGHAFSISLGLLADDSPEPSATEFRRTYDEHNLGLAMEVALNNLALRVPLLDVRFFVAAVLIQSRTGGNLSEILTKLGEVIRERFKLKGQVKALSAHGRLTGKLLTILPVVVVLLMLVVNPEYMSGLMRFPLGKHLIGVAVILMIIAHFCIKKIVNVKA